MNDKATEAQVAVLVAGRVREHLGDGYAVTPAKSILYKIEVNAEGQITPSSLDSPIRGQYAFQTDLLVEKGSPAIPLLAIELKVGGFSTHDVITYSSKAMRHKEIYPYLRYGLLVVDPSEKKLGRKFLTHNEGFDFGLAIRSIDNAVELFALIDRQLKSAERVSHYMRSNRRVSFSRYEEQVEIEE